MRRINQAGKDLIKKSEGCRLTAYQDSKGIWTIGWGHTGASVKPGLTITQHAADVILDSDLEVVEEGVEHATRFAKISENEFAALCSFAFNFGLGALRNSTLLRKFLAGDREGAAEEFPRWVHAGDHIDKGLVTRRESEQALFLTS